MDEYRNWVLYFTLNFRLKPCLSLKKILSTCENGLPALKDIFMMRLNRPHKNNAIDRFLAEHLVIAMKGSFLWKKLNVFTVF